MSHSTWTREATDATFDTEVVERSRQAPVLVDFWAGWCAPCRMLGPTLEKAVEARGGSVWLVKVDVEASPAVAASHGVQGIPVVKAFVDGRVVAEFVGARDRSFVDSFIDQLVPSPEDQAMSRGRELLDRGLPELVGDALAPALASPRHRDGALLLLARSRAASGDATGAEQALGQVGAESPEREAADAMRLELELLAAANGAGEPELRARVESTGGAPDALWALAGTLLRDGRVEGALEALLEILKKDRRYREDGARRAMLAVFESIGTNHDLANEFRRQMQIYL